LPTLSRAFIEPVIIGPSAALEKVLASASRVARGNAKVLITGESGVGKDLIARFIHARSTRRHRAFIALNCAGLSETLLETELFGHVRGSFTGAHRDKAGKLQLAHQGTVFLDEVGEMSLRMQAVLLRFLENGEIQPVGSDTPATSVDVRIISATNRDLRQMVAANEFREDLFYRIQVMHLHVPPLRERTDDIPALLDYLFTRAGRTCVINDEAMGIILRHPWMGNIRELQNVVEQLLGEPTGDAITPDDLPRSMIAEGPALVTPGRERRRQVADELHEALISGSSQFWTHVHTLFMSRDITRKDLRDLLRRGLAHTGGSYRELLALFGMSPTDYKRFLNFLSSHDCAIDFREFRPGVTTRDGTG
jgi:transcriptional regulator with PAS, ATPase and Fis domain